MLFCLPAEDDGEGSNNEQQMSIFTKMLLSKSQQLSQTAEEENKTMIIDHVEATAEERK